MAGSRIAGWPAAAEEERRKRRRRGRLFSKKHRLNTHVVCA